MVVIKRDGRIVNFDKERVYNAIKLAMNRTEKGTDLELADKISDSIEKAQKKKMNVEEKLLRT